MINKLPLYPLYFFPIYKEYLWGGQRISAIFHRDDAPAKVAESWEICDHQEDNSVVMNGPCKGVTLRNLIVQMKEDLIGKGREISNFPLLIKIIDAAENLSIQVHPDSYYAYLLKTEPKTEMWYFLGEKAEVLAGLKENVSPSSFIKHLKNKNLPALLEKISVERGEALFIPAGVVHTILSGSLLLEVQQNSNTTYRLYDWNREDKIGKKARPLHIKEALQVMHWHRKDKRKVSVQVLKNEEGILIEHLLKTPYFEVERITIQKEWNSPKETSGFEIFFLLQGKAVISAENCEEELLYGRACLCPAACQKITICPYHFPCSFLRIR